MRLSLRKQLIPLLKETFLNVVKQYTEDDPLALRLWKEIETAYQNENRQYHNLNHIYNLIQQLISVKDQIQDWNTILFSAFYHDIVYNVRKNDNEEQSALLAEKRLKEVGVSSDQIQKCASQILATKGHHFSSDNDTNLFTDADLSTLGSEWPEYEVYAQQIRKEYEKVPDIFYKPGRKKVLNHFLQMERIFKTEPFFMRFEKQARINIQKELELL